MIENSNIEIKNVIQSIKKEFKYLEIPKEEFDTILENIINNMNKDIIDFRLSITNTLYDILKNRLSNNDIIKKTINNYINQHFIQTDNNDSILINLKKLCIIFKTYKIAPSYDVISYLINTNKTLCDNIEKIFNILERKSIEFENYIDDEDINNTLFLILNTYIELKKNNIEDVSNQTNNNTSNTNINKLYLNEIRKYKDLTREEEIDLANRIKNGDMDAKKKFIESNLKLVVYIAKRYTVSNIDFLDLVQEGNVGLFKAIDKFDPTMGYKFSTFAKFWIVRSISNYIKMNSRLIRPSYKLHSKIIKFRKAKLRLTISLEREPTIEEIAKEINEDIETTILIYQNQAEIISIYSKLNEDTDTELHEIIPDNTISVEELVEDYLLNSDFLKLIKETKIPERTKNMLYMYLGLNGYKPMSYTDIANAYGVSRQSVHENIKKALNRIIISKKLDFFGLNINNNEKLKVLVKKGDINNE